MSCKAFHLILQLTTYPKKTGPKKLRSKENLGSKSVLVKDYVWSKQTWKKLIFVRKPILGVEKYPQIHIVPKHIEVLRFASFAIILDIF